jgi:hypothetical protein
LPNIASPATRSTVGRSINSPRQGSKPAEVLTLLGRDAGTAVLRDRFVLERIKRFQLRMRLKEQAATQAIATKQGHGFLKRTKAAKLGEFIDHDYGRAWCAPK